MTLVSEGLVALFLGLGAFFSLVGGIGLIRMPDFYTRVHAASLIETLGAGLLLLGLILHAGWGLVAIKLVMIGLLIFFASPTASHALARAAWVRGIVPRLGACRTSVVDSEKGADAGILQPTAPKFDRLLAAKEPPSKP